MRLNNRSIFKPKPSKSILNKLDKRNSKKSDSDEATLYLYDEISWWGINAEEFVKSLNALTDSTIHIRFNSPGGSVFDGMAIYNAIKQHKSTIIAHVDGLAASIASVILMAADDVRMGDGAFIMIHEPWSMVVGDAEDMRKEADLLDKVHDVIIDTYVDKCKKKKTRNDISDMMAAETWMTAKEAIDFGFCDSIETGKKKDDDNDNDKDDNDNEENEASNRANILLFDLSAFANVPEALKDAKFQPTARMIEHALRDVGCSQQLAKAILAEGFKEGQRDVDTQEFIPTPVEQRDVAETVVAGKDKVAQLLTRAEVIAPSK